MLSVLSKYLKNTDIEELKRKINLWRGIKKEQSEKLKNRKPGYYGIIEAYEKDHFKYKDAAKQSN